MAEEINLEIKVEMGMEEAMTLTIISHRQAEEINHHTLIMAELMAVVVATTILMRSLNTSLKKGRLL
jgi:hypothetical protein